MAYFLVHSLAVASYRVISVLYKCAILGINGSSGSGAMSIEQTEIRMFQMVVEGDHPSPKISRQIDPSAVMFG